MQSRTFKSPPKKFRSLPFWSWNDNLMPQELVYQIGQFDEQGMGGFFMHSREGLETEYLGPKWQECIKASVSEAKKRGMYAWIYDEDRWPSGAAGGRVTAKGDEFRAKAIVCYCGIAEYQDDTLALFIVNQKQGRYRLTSKEQTHLLQLKDGDIAVSFKRKVSGPSEWFNNDAPADNLNPLCVREFINETYEKYRDWVGTEFGKTVAGIFTDEPNIADRRAVYDNARGYVPYTTGLENSFYEYYGYNIIEKLPALFFDLPDSFKVRHDFWLHVSRIFTNAYTKQIYDWCCDNGLNLTGHFLYENQLGLATRMNGAVMPHYLYQHIPGIDMLCEQTDEYLTVMQCVSVALQTGRKYVISEMYGCTGWDFTFEGQKWIGDWQFALGVNLRCQHLALYSITGCRKRDFPPCFNYNTSWWKKNHLVENYFARLTSMLSEGELQNDVLILHPQSTVCGMLGAEPERPEKWDSDKYLIEADNFGYTFNDLLRELSLNQISYELGDEQIIERLGSVKESKFIIGKRSYHTVVITQAATISNSTYELLCGFVKGGGKLILLNDCLRMIDAADAGDKLSQLKKNENVMMLSHKAELIHELKKQNRGFALTCEAGSAYGILAQLRKKQNQYILFLANNDRKECKKIKICLYGENEVTVYNPLTGEILEAEVFFADGNTYIEKEFMPVESLLLSFTKGKGSTRSVWKGICEKLFTGDTIFRRLSPNVLVLDKCRGGFEESDLGEEKEVWVIQEELRQKLSLRPIYYNGLPQRYKWIDNDKSKRKQALLSFVFYSDEVFTNLRLVVEKLERYKVCFNGEKVDLAIDGYYFDKGFQTAPLPPTRKGLNEIRLTFMLENQCELENIYLIGDFGVSPERRLINEPKMLRPGDYTKQGYLHFAGDMEYIFRKNIKKRSGRKYFIKLRSLMGANAEIRVNAKYAGDIPWRCAQVDITELITDGENTISVVLTSTQRNLFGPFHDAKGDRAWTDWQVFRTTGEDYTDSYHVKPGGLTDDIELFILESGDRDEHE